MYAHFSANYKSNLIFINRLLKQTRDSVLTTTNVVEAFRTCGYRPFDFPNSFAAKRVPPPPPPPLPLSPPPPTPHDAQACTPRVNNQHSQPRHQLRRVRFNISGDSDDSGPEIVECSGTSRSTSYSLFLIEDIRSRSRDVLENPTPRRLRTLHKDVLEQAKSSIPHDSIMTALAGLARAQQTLIESQAAKNLLQESTITHFKGQLAQKTEPKRRGAGAVVKDGYGAMDSEALQAALAERAAKVAAEVDKAKKRQERQKVAAAKRAEKEHKKAEREAARLQRKADKEAQGTQQRRGWGPGHHCRRGLGNGGCGLGRRQCGEYAVPQPFPMLSEDTGAGDGYENLISSLPNTGVSHFGAHPFNSKTFFKLIMTQRICKLTQTPMTIITHLQQHNP
jgi:hypothetical protein